MAYKTPEYTLTAKGLHWLMAAIWVGSWCIGMTAVHFREELNPGHGLTIFHKAIASTVLFLVVLRILWRLTHPAPELPRSMSSAMRKAAHLGHVILYVVALALLPLSGWFWSSVADKPIMVLYLFELPPLVSPDPSLYEFAGWTHAIIGWFCGVLIAGHILVALKHRFIDKDGVFERMT